MLNRALKRSRDAVELVMLAGIIFMLLSACASSTTTTVRGQTEQSGGFFDRLADAITERECNVMHYTCPFGFGPANEPCECTDPNGVVRKGRTIK